MWNIRWQSERGRGLLVAVAIYAAATLTYLLFAAPQTLARHTPYNHFALLAEAWLRGDLALPGAPPAYAGNNDFALYDGRWFIVFPPFPALLLVPLVAFAGSAQDVQDGEFFIWLAGIAPALLFLALEKLRALGAATTSMRQNLVLALLFAFGTVYFFTSVQGTVWYAAHVVGAALAAGYLLCALDAARPLLAGLLLGLGFWTRTPLLFAFPLFVFEAARTSLTAAPSGDLRQRLRQVATGLDRRRFARQLALFASPIVALVVVSFWYNAARFDAPLEFGYQYLTVRWQERMQRWGLFHYHYLARNLGVLLTSLPYAPSEGGPPFRVNAHGLALWVTTPLYLWLLWPRRRHPLWLALVVTALAVALPTLFYQNTGWVQFGQRFSNDYAVFLFALLAVGGYRFGALFRIAAVWSVAVNAFGALSFDRSAFARFYHVDPSQRVIYQPD